MKQTKSKKVLRRIVVRNSPIHGRGVFALRPIHKGARIIEYKGKLITDKEADRRFGRLHENSSHTMLFSVDDGLVIDATRRGNSARWINHSCAPNCEIEEENHRVFIEARRDIRPGRRAGLRLQLADRRKAHKESQTGARLPVRRQALPRHDAGRRRMKSEV